MQEDCTLSFALWKCFVDGRCVESISVALCFSSDSLSQLFRGHVLQCVTGELPWARFEGNEWGF